MSKTNLKLEFNKQIYLNMKPMHIKFKDCEFTLHFATDYKEIIEEKKSTDIFANNSTTIDYKFYLEKEVKGSDVYLKNLVLFKNTSILDLVAIIGTVLECKTTNFDISNNDKFNFKIPFLTYAHFLCVGNEELNFYTNDPISKDYGNYLDEFMKWYFNMTNLYVKNLKLMETKKIKTIEVNYSISNIEVTNYCLRKNVYTDIIKLFNNHNTNYIFKRVIVHDKSLDEYYNVDNVQYVKNVKDFNLSTKHVQGKENVLTLFYSLIINENVTLEYIDIFKSGTYRFCFTIKHKMNIDDIKKVIFDYLKVHNEEIFKLLMLDECSYTSDSVKSLQYTDYNQEVSKLQSFYLINDTTVEDVKNLNILLSIKGFESRFNSNSSIMLNSNAFYDTNIIFDFEQMYLNKGLLNENLTRINTLPETHVTFSNGMTSIFCNKFTNIEELIYNLALFLPFIKCENLHVEEEGEGVEYILNRLKNIPIKQNLKQLSALDTKLFGPRIVLKNPRAYSALCQSKEQRPVPITESEYEVLSKAIPESVFNIENQTYTGQRLYLACPYEDFKYANFHQFNNQLCIVRCTTKLSNPSQYEQCSNDLDNQNINDQKLGHQSHSIIKYNENLPYDRACQLPSELQAVFPDFICMRSDYIMRGMNEDYVSFFQRSFGCIPLIIQRVSDADQYIILSEYELTQDSIKYFLVLQPESKPELKYIVTNSLNYRPFIINDYPDLIEFFNNINKINKLYTEIINYINKKIIQEEVEVENLSFYKYYMLIKNKFNLKLVVKDGNVVGIIKKVNFEEYFYSLPNIVWPYKDSNLYYSADYVLKNYLAGSIKFPKYSLSTLDETTLCPSDDDKICLNINNNKICGIIHIINNSEVLNLCQESDEPLPHNFDFEIYDTDNVLFNKLTDLNKIEIKNKRNLNINLKTEILINHMLCRYTHYNPDYYKDTQKENVENFLKYMTEFGMITTGESQIEQATSNMISSIKSKLNKKVVEDYLKAGNILFNENDVDDILYKEIVNNFNLQKNLNEVIEKKVFL